jgi:hypothetical protein
VLGSDAPSAAGIVGTAGELAAAAARAAGGPDGLFVDTAPEHMPPALSPRSPTSPAVLADARLPVFRAWQKPLWWRLTSCLRAPAPDVRDVTCSLESLVSELLRLRARDLPFDPDAALLAVCADFGEAAKVLKGRPRAAALALASCTADAVSLVDLQPSLRYVCRKRAVDVVLHVRVGDVDEPYAAYVYDGTGWAGTVELVLRDRASGPAHLVPISTPTLWGVGLLVPLVDCPRYLELCSMLVAAKKKGSKRAREGDGEGDGDGEGAAGAPAKATSCDCCGRPFPKGIDVYNLEQHKKGKACRKKDGKGVLDASESAHGEYARRFAPYFPLEIKLARPELRGKPHPPRAASAAVPLDVELGVARVPFPPLPPWAFDAFAAAVSWSANACKVVDGELRVGYLSVQGSQLDELEGGPLASWNHIVDGAQGVMGDGWALLARGYAHGHFLGGTGLKAHQDDPVMPELICVRMTTRWVSGVGWASFLSMRDKRTGAAFDLPLAEGFNIFSARTLGVSADSPYLHGAPAARGIMSISFIFDFEWLGDGARPSIAAIKADYEARVASGEVVVPPRAALRAPPKAGDGSAAGSLCLTVVGVSQLAAKAAHQNALAQAIHHAIDVACDELEKEGVEEEDVTVEMLSERTGLSVEYVEGDARWREAGYMTGFSYQLARCDAVTEEAVATGDEGFIAAARKARTDKVAKQRETSRLLSAAGEQRRARAPAAFTERAL